MDHVLFFCFCLFDVASPAFKQFRHRI
jgi:hypothetical protein